MLDFIWKTVVVYVKGGWKLKSPNGKSILNILELQWRYTMIRRPHQYLDYSITVNHHSAEWEFLV